MNKILLLVIVLFAVAVYWLNTNQASGTGKKENITTHGAKSAIKDIVDVKEVTEIIGQIGGNNLTLDTLPYMPLTQADLDQLNIINHQDFNNLNWSLARPLNPVRKLINNLKETQSPGTKDHSADVCYPEWNYCNCDRGLMNLDKPKTALEGDRAPEIDQAERCRLRSLTPDFLRTSIKEYYGKLYYNDRRYPQRPISVEFAYDPDGYCLRNPQMYPCDLRSSRICLR